jgi:hypothetical protein
MILVDDFDLKTFAHMTAPIHQQTKEKAHHNAEHIWECYGFGQAPPW